MGRHKQALLELWNLPWLGKYAVPIAKQGHSSKGSKVLTRHSWKTFLVMDQTISFPYR